MVYIKSIAATIGGILGFIYGELDGALLALVTFVIMDYITGVISACVNHQLSSEVGFKGILRKIIIFIIVGVANIIDTKLLEKGSTFRTASIFFYISNEGISILENAIEMKVPIPNKIKDMLVQLKGKDDED